MNTDKREVISGISAAVGAELIVVLVIFIGAAIGANIHSITSAISAWGSW